MKKITLAEAAVVLGKSKATPVSSAAKKFTLSEALDIANRLGINFDAVEFTPEEYLEGLNIELEHGLEDSETNVTSNDPIVTGKIALAHLKETPLYYNADVGLEAWEHAIKELKGSPKGKKIRIV